MKLLFERILKTILPIFVFAFISYNANSQSIETKGKDYELVVGVPGITQSAISEVRTTLADNTAIDQIIFCPKHEVFLVFLNQKVTYDVNDKSKGNASAILHSIEQSSGRTAFRKEVTATEFYSECSNYLKN